MADVRAMSVWEFNAFVGGWLRANGVDGPDAMQPETETALSALLDQVTVH